MIPLQKYLEIKDIGIRAFYYQLGQKKIFKKEQDGEIFVIDPEITLSSEAKQTLQDEAKKELDGLILKAHALRSESIKIAKQNLVKTPHNKQVKELIDLIQRRLEVWNRRGVSLRGYSEKACYKKISDVRLLDRQRREDLFTIKNPLLAKTEVYEKLKVLVLKLYFADGSKEPSLRMIIKRIVMYSQKKEELYELAAVPFSTLYDHAKKIIDASGAKHKHLLKNHHQEFDRKRPYVLGAFTNMDFMEYYAMDDHVMEVNGALFYNDVTQKLELKKVYLWTIIECKTLQVIAYKIQADSFNSDDLKVLMLQALSSMGRPGKSILMDNGLGSSNKCTQFLDRLKINHDPGPAYEPLHKAVQERIFGFIKNEFCAQWPNYIGGGRSEVRHTTKRLSPEECTFTVQEFISAFDNYMEGFYQTNIRTRTDNGVKMEISIRDHFNKYYSSYEKSQIKPVDLRYAFMESAIKHFGSQTLLMGNKGVFNPSVGSPLHPVLCDRNYQVVWNPLDYTEIDMYAIEDIIIQETGEYYLKGTKVATLYNQLSKSNIENQSLVATLRKKHTKATRQLAEATTNVTVAENFHAFSPELNEKGQVIDTRKELHERVSNVIDDGANKALEVTIPEFKKRGRKSVELEEDEFSEELNQLNDLAEDFDL